jgi:poly(A) polymerase
MAQGKAPLIIPRPEHNISRAFISENAVKVLYRLRAAGFQAHLVGGGVRDLLLGREPKDFDVATDARPEQVRQIFRNCRLIGRRFRLAHVQYGAEIIEVATFRAMNVSDDEEEAGRPRHRERHDPARQRLWQHRGRRLPPGLHRQRPLLQHRGLLGHRLCGGHGGPAFRHPAPDRRPGGPLSRGPGAHAAGGALRRQARLPHRPRLRGTDPPPRQLLEAVPPARLFEEVLKLFQAGSAVPSFEKLRHYHLFEELFPATDEALSHEDHEFPITFVLQALQNTDDRVREGKPVTPVFLFAALLWEPVRQRYEELLAVRRAAPYPAMEQAASEVLAEQARHVAIPKRFSLPMRELWGPATPFRAAQRQAALQPDEPPQVSRRLRLSGAAGRRRGGG